MKSTARFAGGALFLGTVRASGAVLPDHDDSCDVHASALMAREGGALNYSLIGVAEGVPMDCILRAPPAVAHLLWDASTVEAP